MYILYAEGVIRLKSIKFFSYFTDVHNFVPSILLYPFTALYCKLNCIHTVVNEIIAMLKMHLKALR